MGLPRSNVAARRPVLSISVRFDHFRPLGDLPDRLHIGTFGPPRILHRPRGPGAGPALDNPLILRLQRLGRSLVRKLGDRDPRSENRMRNLIGLNRYPLPGSSRWIQPDPGLL